MRNLLKAIQNSSNPSNISFKEKLYIGETGCKPLDLISDKYHDTTTWFRVKKEMVERMFFWGWKMRYSYDFDAHTIYEMLYLKLDKIYACMRDNSHLVWNDDEQSKGMRRLCEAKHLAKRLSEFDYDTQGFIETKEKFGFKSWSEKIEGEPRLFRWRSWWLKNSEQAKLHRKARNKHYAEMEKNDKKRFYELLEKHLDGWWD